MSYFDSLIFEELKKLNKNMEKLAHGVNVLAGLESPGIINEADLQVLARHIGPGIAGMSAEEAKAAGWEKPGDTVDIEAILERADVAWLDDYISGHRVVTSRNPGAPLTESEQNILKRMWKAQGVNLHIVFRDSEGGN